MHNNGFAGIGAALAAQAAGAAPPIQLAAPFNDIQLVAMIASQRPDVPVGEAVAWATDIVAEAVGQADRLAEAIKLKRALSARK